MMKHLGTVALETPRLLLRRFTLDDAADMFNNWANDDAVTKFLTWPTHQSVGVSKEVLSKWVADYQSEKCYQWCVALKETGKAVGSIGVVSLKENIDAAEIGYCIGRAWWHQGITLEALAAVVGFLFKEVGFNRLAAHHDPHNPNSGKVMQKCGMLYEGTAIQASRNNTGICDTAMYAMINPGK
jgi:ribosomal-protein-alanine N-acetyltransferase